MQVLEERRKELKEMNDLHSAVAKALLSKAVARLQTLDGKDIPISQLPIFVREATAVQRRAMGEPTEVARQQHEVGTGDDFGERVRSNPGATRAATDLLAYLAGAKDVPDDAGGHGVATQQGTMAPGASPTVPEREAGRPGDATDSPSDHPHAAAAWEESPD